MQSIWFKRLKRDLKKISPHLRMKKLKLGFWRIYWKDHYIHEVFEEMPAIGYTLETYDPRLENQSYYEEYEDHVELVRTIKNFVEGYWDSIRRIQRRVYMLLHDPEFFERSQRAYKQMVIK